MSECVRECVEGMLHYLVCACACARANPTSTQHINQELVNSPCCFLAPLPGSLPMVVVALRAELPDWLCVLT